MKNTYTELNGLLQDVQIKIKGDSGVNQVQTWDGSFCAFRTDSELFTNKAKAEKYFGHKVWAV